jgi:hypothetical protein
MILFYVSFFSIIYTFCNLKTCYRLDNKIKKLIFLIKKLSIEKKDIKKFN